MKILKIVIGVMIMLMITSVMVFAAPPAPGQKNDTGKRQSEYKEKDPIKRLQLKKEQIQRRAKEGKITKEKADEIITEIDKRVEAITEFNKLPLEQKREKLISNFKAVMDKKVQEGRITTQKANEKMKEFTEKVKKWNGKGCPEFFGKDKWHKKGWKKKSE